MMRTHGRPVRLIAGNSTTLSTQVTSGLMRCRWAFSPASAMIALSTIASHTGTT